MVDNNRGKIGWMYVWARSGERRVTSCDNSERHWQQEEHINGQERDGTEDEYQ